MLEREHLQDNARTTGDYVLAGLGKLAAKHSLIGEVRGQGLFFGVELVRDRGTRAPATAESKRIANAMRDRGVLISHIGPHDNVLKIRPPMPFAKEHADLLVTTLDEVLAGA